jgi:hypothetical protein
MKIEYIPTNARGIVYAGAGGQIGKLWFSSDMNTYNLAPVSDTQLMQSSQTKILDPSRPFRKYLNFKALSKSQNYKWQNTNEAF